MLWGRALDKSSQTEPNKSSELIPIVCSFNGSSAKESDLVLFSATLVSRATGLAFFWG